MDNINLGGSSSDLSYFIGLHEYRPAHSPIHTAEKWDRRADAWEKDGPHKNDDRVQAAAEYLKSRGLLGPDCDVADIGCGPGRFAAAFARTARSVTGFDISEKMVSYGRAHVKGQGLSNVSFHVCDFQTLDMEKEGLVNRFDLVFSSLTPAIHGMRGLEQVMGMSRGYCCDITQLSSENQLESRIMRALFGRERPVHGMGRWFYSLFNLLFLMGYFPEATYYKRRQERRIRPSRERAEIFLELMLEPQERTRENMLRIEDWMRGNADGEGLLTEVGTTWYGRLLWDVRERTARPDYRPAE